MFIKRNFVFRLILSAFVSLFAVACVTSAQDGLLDGAAGVEGNVIELKECAIEGLESVGMCGSVIVPENSSDPDGRKISLKVLIVPATESSRAPDPIFYFEGGPGGSATMFANVIASYVLPAAKPVRDLVFFDQRGTGESNLLICPEQEKSALQELLTPGLSNTEIAACKAKLATHADLRFYSTEHAADDVDVVRRALGYDSINLFGSSYGTRLALSYMRRHPKHVRSAILTSVVPMDRREPLNTAVDTEDAINNLITLCQADEICRQVYPNLFEKLVRAASSVTSQGQKVTIKNPVTEEIETAYLGKDAFSLALRGLLYEPWGYARFPSFITPAAQGDFTLFAEEYASINAGYRDERYADGLYYTILCSEDFGFADLDEAFRKAEGTFFGDVRIRLYQRICADWPRANLSDDFLKPVKHHAPILILSGRLDAATPPKYGDQIATSLLNSRHLIVENDGHNVGDSWPGCMQEIVATFLETLKPNQLKTGCLDSIPGPEWVLPEPPQTKN